GEAQPARQVGKAIRRLVELGLVDEEADGALRMHRLVAMFVQERSSDAEAQAVVEQVVLQTANRLNDAGIPAPLLALQAHLRAVVDAALQREDERAASLCSALGGHLQMIAEYARARGYYERALAIRERVYGSDHPEVATDLNNLASLLRTQGSTPPPAHC